MPDDVEALRAALAAATFRADQAEVALLGARARQSDDQALIAHLKLQIEKLRHQLFGSKSERRSRLLDQLELQLEELEATASQDAAIAQVAAHKVANAPGFERRRPELCGNLGDKVDQAALCGFISMTSIPSWNLTPASSFGN